jgi:hypothetical protein
MMNQDCREENFETFQFEKEPEDLWNNFLQESYNKTSLRKLLPQTSQNKSMLLQRPSESFKNERKWKVILSNSKILFDMNQEPFSANIEVRTRNETSPYSVPEKLYSSLKYELTQELPSLCLGSNISVLMAKIQAVNPYNTNEEILKPNSKPILMGTQEYIPLTLTQGSFYSKTKIQFTDVSYHHEKKYFAFKVSYFEPTNLQEPLLVQLSSPFQVFARRPRKNIKRRASITSKVSAPKKVKKEEYIPEVEEEEEEDEEEEQTRIVSPATSQTAVTVNASSTSAFSAVVEEKILESSSPVKQENKLAQFLEYLDILAKFKESLTEEEKKIAKENIELKLLDREFSSFDHFPEFDICSLENPFE